MNKMFLIFLIPTILFSQEFNFVFEPDSIPVEVEGWNPYCPFAGGYSESSPDFCDIDNDGDLDLFIGHSDYTVDYYINNGTSIIPNFDLYSFCWDSLISIGEWKSNPDFWDMDNDGDLDCVIGSGLVTYVENLGDVFQPDFTSNRIQLFDTSGNAVFGTHVALIDIDVDGDGDLVCGEYQGYLILYLNVGTIDSFAFALDSFNWLGINVGDDADPCFIDIDGDNDLDLFIGNELGVIWYYRNDGDSANYNFTYVTNYYENIYVGNYASPEFADIDGDGDYDLFVGPGGWTWFYENVGTQIEPSFRYITNNYLTYEPGPYSQFVDINGDDAPDIISGGYTTLKYTENIGTATEPSFSYVEFGFLGVSRPGIMPCFVDLDADGDYDLLAGESVIPGPPTIAYYENIGTPQEPHLRLENENFIVNADFWVNVNPGVADIDADGDFDLFVSDDHGHFFFYQNNGSPSQPSFQLVSAQWQGIQFYYPNYYWRGFSFGDIDEDGDFDLLITDFNIRFYRNEGNAVSASMQLETEEFIPGFEFGGSIPFLVDIDEDSDLDLFVGEYFGGIMFFRNHGYMQTGVTLTLTPQGTPIQIPAIGGFFQFDVEIANLDTVGYVIDAVLEAILPGGSVQPIMTRSNIVLSVGSTLIRENMVQNVPGRAPTGDYSYNGYILDHTTLDTLAVDSFEFEKLGGLGIPNNNLGWDLDGWGEEAGEILLQPLEFELFGAYPNPFNQSTVVSYQLPVKSYVNLTVYDVLGREVQSLVIGRQSAGYHEVVWDASGVGSGVYLVKLGSGDEVFGVKKLVLIK